MSNWIQAIRDWLVVPPAPTRYGYVIVGEDVQYCCLSKDMFEHYNQIHRRIKDEDLWYCHELGYCVGRTEKIYDTKSEAIEGLILLLEQKVTRAQRLIELSKGIIAEKKDYVEFLKDTLVKHKAKETVETIEEKTGTELKSNALSDYLILQNTLKQLDYIHVAQESDLVQVPEESETRDAILDVMDIVWAKLTDEEKAKLNDHH